MSQIVSNPIILEIGGEEVIINQPPSNPAEIGNDVTLINQPINDNGEFLLNEFPGVNDFLGGGEELFIGGSGRDIIRLPSNNATQFTDTTNVIASGRGEDIILGGESSDRAFGGRDDDFVDGGGGNDEVNGNRGDDIVTGGEGNDISFGGKDDDVVDGGGGNDETYGNRGNDTVSGGDGNDLVSGNRGNDTVLGGLGNDTVYGGKGDDLIEGGGGNDLLEGGRGADIFRFEFFESETLIRDGTLISGFDTLNNVVPGDSGVDTLTDFTPGEDKIQLDANSFSELIGSDGNFNPDEFTTLDEFAQNPDANLVYDSNQGLMYYIDGNGNAIQFLQLEDNPDITGDDFETI